MCWRCGWWDEAWPTGDPLRTTWDSAAGLQVAHLVDHCAGGSGDPSNMVLLCRPCHAQMPGFLPGDRAAALVWVGSSWVGSVRASTELLRRGLDAGLDARSALSAVFGSRCVGLLGIAAGESVDDVLSRWRSEAFGRVVSARQSR